MSLKQLKLKKRMVLKAGELVALEEELKQLSLREKALEDSLEEATTDEDLNLIEEEIESLEQDKVKKEEKKKSLEDEISEIEKELEDVEERTKQTLREKRSGDMPLKEARAAVNNFVRTRAITDGFKVEDGGVLVPEELYKAKEVDPQTVKLKSFISEVSVNSGAGKYPFIKKSGSKMNTVAELAANPELSKPTIEDIKYDIDTYRGYIPISQEVIDDADYDITGLISREIENQGTNTENHEIATVLKSATAKSVQGLDGLKTLINKDIKRSYNVSLIISSSFYNALDLLKDKTGKYLLQDDITSPTGKSIFGRPVVVLDDELIGTSKGDMNGFIGDAKAFATFFDRKRTSVDWINNDVYGKLLGLFIRFDVVKTDKDAGFYVTYTDAPVV